MSIDIHTNKSHTNENQTNETNYNPGRFLDSLIAKLRLKNDAHLCRTLGVLPPVVSKIRHRKLPVGASLLIRSHEISELSIRELRDLLGDRRTNFRVSPIQGVMKKA